MASLKNLFVKIENADANYLMNMFQAGFTQLTSFVLIKHFPLKVMTHNVSPS